MIKTKIAPILEKTKKVRFLALDSLRGLAILFVILNHIPHDGWYRYLPSYIYPLIVFFSANGRTAVAILFLLTSFLMGWLHSKPKSYSSFIGRRYIRLFPAFLVMVVVLTIRDFLKQSVYLTTTKPEYMIKTEFMIFIAVAVIARLLWNFGIWLDSKYKIGNKILVSWIFLQASVGFWYLFVLQKISPAIYYQIWSKNLQILVVGLVNATLNIHLGRYIAQLDGVYWSLVLEVLFYLTFPILFIPILKAFRNNHSQKKLKDKFANKSLIIFLLSFPFFFALNIIAKLVLGLSVLQPSFIVFFIAGSSIGYNLDWFRNKLKTSSKYLFHSSLILILLLIIFGHLLFFSFIPNLYHPLVNILLVIPTSWLLLILIKGDEKLPRWCFSPWLAVIGKYSYSMYIVHSLVISWITKIIVPDSLSSQIQLIIVTLIGVFGVSWILYHLIEAPYFTMRKNQNRNKKILQTQKKVHKNINKKIHPLVCKLSKLFLDSKFAVLSILFIFTALLYFAYLPNLSLSTTVRSHNILQFPGSLFKNKVTELTAEPTQFSFVGSDDNLGMITSHISSEAVSGVNDISDKPSLLHIKLMDEGGQEIAKSSFEAHVLGDSRYHPFGFPIQTDSKGKKYLLEYSVEFNDFSRKIFLKQKEGSFLSVYFMDKKELISNPVKLSRWFFLKISEPLSNPYFWFYGMLITPFFVSLVWVVKEE